MVYYFKSYRIVDRKHMWIVIEENYNMTKIPTKEQLRIEDIKNWLKGGI